MDIDEANDIAKKVISKFPKTQYEIQRVDEYVYLYLRPSKSKKELEEDEKRKNKDLEKNKSVKLISEKLNISQEKAINRIDSLSNAKEQYDLYKNHSYDSFTNSFKVKTLYDNGKKFKSAKEVFDYISKDAFINEFFKESKNVAFISFYGITDELKINFNTSRKSGYNEYGYWYNMSINGLDYDRSDDKGVLIEKLKKAISNFITAYNIYVLNDYKSEKETPAESKSDLEYLNQLLATSNDLLDLISDTGSKADIDFLKSKIEATENLISLLADDKFSKGGGVTYPDLSMQIPQVVNDSVVLDEFFIKKTKNTFKINDFYKKITSSDNAVKILREIWEADTINAYEQAYIMYLNKSNNLIGYYHHSTGGIDGTIMDVQMICGLAVKSLAKGVIIAHNHPSQNRHPSDADRQISLQLKTALKTFNITLVDSMIITDDSYLSFADEGFLS